jgi:hypothetical protein
MEINLERNSTTRRAWVDVWSRGRNITIAYWSKDKAMTDDQIISECRQRAEFASEVMRNYKNNSGEDMLATVKRLMRERFG